MIKHGFVTLFNISYLSRGVAMLKSLNRHAADSRLFVIAMDHHTVEVLGKIGIQNLTIISMEDFETPELLRVKPQRSFGEYCWTCTPQSILHVLQNYDCNSVTYVDADLFFFHSPAPLFAEIKDHAVQLSPHWFSHRILTSTNLIAAGYYCVQHLTFHNSETAKKPLVWWRDACLEWCYNQMDGERFGDQKYLDGWLSKWEGICEIKHRGGGVGPWNQEEYQFYEGPLLDFRGQKYPVIFFHFHGLKIFSDGIYDACDGYPISSLVHELIYTPYLKLLSEVSKQIRAIKPELTKEQINLFYLPQQRNWFKSLKRRIKGTYNYRRLAENVDF